ncbi:MAG: zinc ribbon domain-containing protein [Elusimicrobia bacterium]|nr:zinc ribbon domain-containing protein [Elusimicrobiota bacterium]
MALVKCPECGHEISDKALQCVRCGYPVKPDIEKKQTPPNIASANTAALTGSLQSPKAKIGLFGYIALAVLIFLVVVLSYHPKRVFEVNDRVTVVDSDKQLTGYIEGGNELSYLFGGKGHMVEIPESEKATNGEKGTVERVSYERETPDIRYYTDGTQKVVGYTHSGEKKYTVKLDSGKKIQIFGEGLEKIKDNGKSKENKEDASRLYNKYFRSPQ